MTALIKTTPLISDPGIPIPLFYQKTQYGKELHTDEGEPLSVPALKARTWLAFLQERSKLQTKSVIHMDYHMVVSTYVPEDNLPKPMDWEPLFVSNDVSGVIYVYNFHEIQYQPGIIVLRNNENVVKAFNTVIQYSQKWLAKHPEKYTELVQQLNILETQ